MNVALWAEIRRLSEIEGLSQHVGKFMREHARQLFPAHELEQPLGHGHRRVLGVAAGREGVRRLLRDYVDLRHGKVGPLAERLHRFPQLGGFLGSHCLGIVHPENDLVREPVAEEVHAGGHQEGHEHPLLPAEPAPDQDDQGGQRRQQQSGANLIAHSFNSFDDPRCGSRSEITLLLAQNIAQIDAKAISGGSLCAPSVRTGAARFSYQCTVRQFEKHLL